MKKLVLFAAVAFAASMVSCGGDNKAAATDTDSVAAEVVEVVEEAPACACQTDSTAECTCDSCACATVEAAEVVEAPAAE